MSLREQISLEPEQEGLLALMVETQRSVPREQRHPFHVMKAMGRPPTLWHPALKHEETFISEGDVLTLAEYNLLRVGYTSRGSQTYDVTNTGYAYYEEMKYAQGTPLERVQIEIRNYFEDLGSFRMNHADAFRKWVEAEEVLWKKDSETRLSTVGHLCREAVILFTDKLVEVHKPESVDEDSQHVVRRVEAVLKQRSRIGKAENEALGNLVRYWYSLNQLIQRQEHEAVREAESLMWEDARRVVFVTAFLLFEIHRATTRPG